MWEEGWWVIQDVAVTPREGRVSRNTTATFSVYNLSVAPHKASLGPPRLSASASYNRKNIDGLERFRFHKSPLMKRIIKDEDRNSGTLEELSMKENTEKLFCASNIQVSLDFEKVKRYRKVWNIIRS